MIKYNANAPEIKDHPQYNVLKGFGIWSLVCGSFLILWLLIDLYWFLVSFGPFGRYQFEIYFWVSNIFTFASFVFLIIFAFGTGLGVLKKKSTTPKFVRRWSNIAVGLALVVLGWVLIPMTLRLISNNNTNTGHLMFYVHNAIVVVLQAGLYIYVLLAVKKLFQQPYIQHYLSENRLSILYEYDSGEGTDPRLITLFKDWSPLYAYGRLMLYVGISLTAFFLIVMLEGLMSRTIDSDSLHTAIGWTLLLIALGVVVGVSGYGLSKYKEWARMMTVIIHTILMLLPVFLLLSFMQQAPTGERIGIFIFIFVIAILLMFPIFHWCYFVIRTSTSPVVKYVCLRGGYDIE